MGCVNTYIGRATLQGEMDVGGCLERAPIGCRSTLWLDGFGRCGNFQHMVLSSASMEEKVQEAAHISGPAGETAHPDSEAPADAVELLNGGTEAFPRMLAAIAKARRRIHLEVYGFEREGVGAQFLQALSAAAKREVRVRVIVDGWGSMLDSSYIAAVLRKAGCEVKIYNPLWNLFLGRVWRNHRKILLVDDALAFVGGINIGNPYASQGERLGWADLAVEIRGSACQQLVRRVWGGVGRVPIRDVRILLPGLGGGQRLRKRYLKAIGRAQAKVSLAHAYFLPDRRLVRSLTAAARRGVRVVLLLAGRSDVPFARSAAMRLYRKFLKAGVEIFEWSESVMHAKALVVDERRLLVGSFNLDPLSLVNLEVLVDVENPAVSVKAEAWIADHVARSHQIGSEDCEGSALQRWFLDALGLVVARVAEQVARFLAPRRISR